MEWIADDGFAIAMGGPYAYGSVNIDVRVRLTGSEWADGQVRGMRIYDLYTGEEVMRGKAGSCRLQPGEYTLHYGAAVRREDGTFECRYGTADFEVTLPGFELTMPILSHPEDTVAAQSKWLEYTHDEAEQMKELVDDLLFLAKSDAARQPAARAETAMSEVALGCLLPFESVAFEAGVALKHRITPGLSLRGDEGQLRRLVMILLDNAVKYAGPGGTVTFTLERHQERLRLAVHNTGEPIPPEHLPHLFERFYRADAARNRSGGGYGLGLAIARSIVEGHHGRLTVTSTAAAGTTFTALLPRR